MGRVSRAKLALELDRIAELLGAQVGGMSREAIGLEYQQRHGTVIAERTLVRRLERLIIEGRARTEGEGRSTVYRSAVIPGVESAIHDLPTYSAQGLRLRALVSRSLADRAPVGYDIEWLRGYTPGKTWYLSKPDRARLHALGRTPAEDRPAGTFARDILGRLLIDLSWASSRLEGNTYSRLDTQNLLEFGQRAEGKDVAETQMILNHKRAIEYIVQEAGEAEIRPSTILAIHAMLSENLLDDASDEGKLRERPVEISGSAFTPTAVPQLIDEGFQRIVDALHAIPDTFEQALFALTQLAYLQPFIDVNKRTSRLVANLCLLRANLCPLSFVGADEVAYVQGTLAVYEHRRTELLRDFFVRAYQQSAAKYRVVRASVPKPDPVRLRYQAELREVVRAIVLAGHAPSVPTVRTVAAPLAVAGEDRERFESLALELLIGLNEGSAARYGLRPSEFRSWSEGLRVR